MPLSSRMLAALSPNCPMELSAKGCAMASMCAPAFAKHCSGIFTWSHRPAAALMNDLVRSTGPLQPGPRPSASPIPVCPLRKIPDHIRYAASLGARQPGGDECIRCIDLRVDPQWPAGEEHGDHGHALPMQPADQLQVRRVARTVLDRANVSLKLGVRIFSEHHYGHTGAHLEVACGAELGSSAAGCDRCQDPRVNGSRTL